jgi:hypothetical protein
MDVPKQHGPDQVDEHRMPRVDQVHEPIELRNPARRGQALDVEVRAQCRKPLRCELFHLETAEDTGQQGEIVCGFLDIVKDSFGALLETGNQRHKYDQGQQEVTSQSRQCSDGQVDHSGLSRQIDEQRDHGTCADRRKQPRNRTES